MQEWRRMKAYGGWWEEIGHICLPCDGPIDFNVSWDSGEVRQQDGRELTAEKEIERERRQMESRDYMEHTEETFASHMEKLSQGLDLSSYDVWSQKSNYTNVLFLVSI